MSRQELEEGELCALCGELATTTCPSCLDPLCAKCNSRHNPDDCLTELVEQVEEKPNLADYTPFKPKQDREW